MEKLKKRYDKFIKYLEREGRGPEPTETEQKVMGINTIVVLVCVVIAFISNIRLGVFMCIVWMYFDISTIIVSDDRLAVIKQKIEPTTFIFLISIVATLMFEWDLWLFLVIYLLTILMWEILGVKTLIVSDDKLTVFKQKSGYILTYLISFILVWLLGWDWWLALVLPLVWIVVSRVVIARLSN